MSPGPINLYSHTFFNPTLLVGSSCLEFLSNRGKACSWPGSLLLSNQQYCDPSKEHPDHLQQTDISAGSVTRAGIGISRIPRKEVKYDWIDIDELRDLLDSNPESSDSNIFPSTSARCIPHHIAAHHSARRTVVHYIASRTNSHRSTLRTSRAKLGIIRRADCAIFQFGISCLDHFRLLDRGLYDPICTPAVNLFRILSFCDPATRSRPQHRDSRNIS